MKKFWLALLLTFMVSTAQAELSVEIGPTFLSDSRAKGFMLLGQERFGKYDIGLGYVSQQKFNHPCGPEFARTVRCDFELNENIFFNAQRIFSTGNWEFGLGVGAFQNTNRALGRNFTFSTSGRYTLSSGLFISFRHFSNAGSGTPNLGQDAINIGWTFK